MPRDFLPSLLAFLASTTCLAACTPQDILNRQGQSLVNKDYVQEALDAEKKKEASQATEKQKKDAAAAGIKVHADKAQAHTDLLEYDAANREWREAYRLSNDPVYLLRVGDSARATGDCVEAQSMYN